VVQEHLGTFLAQVEAKTGTGLPEIVKDEFEAYLECGILAHGFLRVRCADCAHEKRVAFSGKRRRFCPSCGAQRIPRIVATTPCPKTIPDFAALHPGYTPVPLHHPPRDR